MTFSPLVDNLLNGFKKAGSGQFMNIPASKEWNKLARGEYTDFLELKNCLLY